MNILDKFKFTQTSWWQRHRRFATVLSIVVAIVVVIGVALLLWGLANIKSARALYDEAMAAKSSLEYAQVAVADQNFELAEQDLAEAKKHLEASQEGLEKFAVYKFIPVVSRQLDAVDKIVQAGIHITDGLQGLAALGSEVNNVIAEGGEEISIADITDEQKRAVLQKLSESPAELQGVKSSIEIAVLLIEEIPEEGLLKQVKQAVDPVKQQLPLLEVLINQAIPMAQTIPTIAGYPQEKTYLFLLQNNRELRPTGGFIGTYGILKLKDGEIQTFDTDNIYVLDNAAADFITTPSPEPVAAHTTTQNDLLRNINWSPHFPATALKAEERYIEEEQYLEEGIKANSDIDGVIAVTPSLIEDLLDVIGPQVVDGYEFTPDNLFDNLEYETQYAYYDKGIDDLSRKDIIGNLASQMMDEIFALPKSRFPELLNAFLENVDQKHVLIYVNDPITQQLVVEQNWAGEMKPYTADYLQFVDANLAALKTDKVLERDITYRVSKEDGVYYGEASMEYRHTGWFDHYTTRYRSHTRVYLPAGAEVVDSDGFVTNDKTRGGVATEPAVSTESFAHADGSEVSYTVAEGFFSVEPQQTGQLRLKYKLPESVVEAIEDGRYELYAQKQAGTWSHGFDMTFDIGKRIDSATPVEGMTVGGNEARYEGDLLTDREISVKL